MTAEIIDGHTAVFYLHVPGSQIVQFQAIFELYEGLGVVRTLSVKRSLVCVMTTPDLVESCTLALEALKPQIPWEFVERPSEADRELFTGYFRKRGEV